MVESCLAQGYDHLVRDGIMKNIDKLNVYGYKFEGHLGIVNSIQGYYKHSMQLLESSDMAGAVLPEEPDLYEG